MDLKQVLAKSSFKYELISHPKPIRSAREGAAFFGIAMGQTAPTLIIETQGKVTKDFYALILSGDRGKADLKIVARLLGYPRVKLADFGHVKQITGFNVGVIPLIGLELPCVLDRNLFRFSFIYGGTGKQLLTLKVEPAALLEFNRVEAFLD